MRVALLLLSGLLAIAASGGVAGAQAAEHGSIVKAGPYSADIAEASHRFGIPEAWIGAVIQIESGGDRHAVSPKGAMGLMQLMPGTWAGMRARYRLGRDPFDAHDNILAGAAYLRELHDRYGTISGMLAAYNAGPIRYDDHLSTGRPLPVETRSYVAAFLRAIGDPGSALMLLAGRSTPSWAVAPLSETHTDDRFSALSMHAGRNPNAAFMASSVQDLSGLVPRPDGLFVALSTARPAP